MRAFFDVAAPPSQFEVDNQILITRNDNCGVFEGVNRQQLTIVD
jgi:hypothetical protein